MSKLNIMPSPNPQEETAGKSGSSPVKRKRNFEVVDTYALYALYPQFFKLVPDYAKIRQAIKLGFPVPGVIFTDETVNGPEEENQAQQYQGE